MAERVRLGLVPPVVQRNPRFDPPAWEETAGPDELAEIAVTADELGYDFLCFPEHVGIPGEAAGRRGSRYYAPLPAMGFVAAQTSRIALATYCAVLPYHHPLELVKQLGTLDVLSGGRVIIGVGVGSLEPEFELLGIDFAGRGAYADDALRALRACFGDPRPSYHGTHVDIDALTVDPCGLPRQPEIWVGGRTRSSLRRALDLGDAWSPFGLLLPELEALVAAVGRPLRTAQGERLGLVLAPEPPIDPLGAPEETVTTLRRYAAFGATALPLRFRHDSLTHYLDQLDALAGLRDQIQVQPPRH